MNVIDYCKEEVRRQGHDITEHEGIERTAWMLHAWSTAIVQSGVIRASIRLPTISQIEDAGIMVECIQNQRGFRRVPVMVGYSTDTASPNEIYPRLERLWDQILLFKSPHMSSLDRFNMAVQFYKEFELVHPFIDGNGRTGKILLNWLNGTLLDPVFPPSNLWGREIQNP